MAGLGNTRELSAVGKTQNLVKLSISTTYGISSQLMRAVCGVALGYSKVDT